MPAVDYNTLRHTHKKVKTLQAIREANDVVSRRDQLNDLLYDQIVTEINTNNPELISDIIKGKKGRDLLEKIIGEVIDKSEHTVGFAKAELIQEQIDQILGWGKLQPLISNQEGITNIFTNSKLEVIKRVKGKDIKTNIKFDSDEEIERFIRNIMIRTGETINRDKCTAEAYDHLYNVRIQAAIYGSPTRKEVVKRPNLVLRLYPASNFTKEDFIKNETMSQEISKFLEEYTLDSTTVIAGQPDAGKSTIMDLILNFDDTMKRTIVIEEEAESKFESDNSIFFEERKGGREDLRIKYDMAEFAKICTRLAGKKVVIHEVRGKEAWFLKRLIDMGYTALYTIHAESCEKALEQTAWLMSLNDIKMSDDKIIKSLTKSIKFIIYVEQRKIIDIAEVIGYDDVKQEPKLNYIFKLNINEQGELYWEQGKLSPEFQKQVAIKRKLAEREV